MAKSISITTPFGVAVYPSISKPDVGRNEYSDGKYKTNLELAPADLAAVKKQLEAAAKELLPTVKNPKLPIKTLKDGRVTIIAKGKNRPIITDSRNNKVKAEIGGGSVIRLAVGVGTYPKGAATGINLYLNGVQVKELHEPGNVKFDDIEDGYVEDADAIFEDVEEDGDDAARL